MTPTTGPAPRFASTITSAESEVGSVAEGQEPAVDTKKKKCAQEKVPLKAGAHPTNQDQLPELSRHCGDLQRFKTQGATRGAGFFGQVLLKYIEAEKAQFQRCSSNSMGVRGGRAVRL